MKRGRIIAWLFALSGALFIGMPSAAAKECKPAKKTAADSSVFNNGLQFTFVNSTSFAYKLHPRAGNYWRFGVSLSGNTGSEDSDYNSTNFALRDTAYYAYKNSSVKHRFYISFNTDYLIPLVENDWITVYSGGGLFVNYFFYKDDIERLRTSQPGGEKNISEFSRESVGLGLRAIGGLEGHVTSRITLFAEMNLYAFKSWFKNRDTYKFENSYDTRTENKENGQRLETGVSNIRIGLNVYF